ncbi:MAG: NTP transferase domain-containing protein [Candidatus Woesearchaeota archaeon]
MERIEERINSDYENYSLPAFVLCGKSPADKIVDKEELGEMPINNKAFLKLKEQPMIDYVIKALLNSKNIGDIYVITHKDEEPTFKKELERIICSAPYRHPRIIHLIGYSEDNLIRNIERTFKESELRNESYALITSSDTPLINPKLVNDFLKNVYYLKGYDVYIPYTKISMLNAKYSEIKKRSMFELLIEEENEKRREGVRTGNMFVLKKETFIQNKNLFEYLFKTRKKGYLSIAKDIAAKLIKNNEFETLYKITKKLINKEIGIEDISLVVKHAYNISAKGILVEPEFCIDVDKKRDYEEIKKYFL